MRIVHLYRDGVWLAGPLELAETVAERTQGLLGRDGLPGRSGMVFDGCGSVHTFFMRFPIDVVFLAGDSTVRKVAPVVKPFRMALSPFSRWTVELPAGLARELGLARGQRLEFRGSGPDAVRPAPP
ncbi:MAG: DUF192 domain-containing protein [Planctomycetes bacterium]|jgi:hypothetical protein|nr:DUF192 domain-containing protein [Planctomycetota bacterium]